MFFLDIFAPLHVATNIVRRAQIEKAQSTLHQNPNQNFHHSSFINIGLIITIISLRLKLKFHFSAETKFLWKKALTWIANAVQVTLRLSVNNPCLCLFLCFLIILVNFQKNDHVDNNRLPKKIKPLPLHSRVVYLEKISHFTQVLSDSLVGCPASGVNWCQLTKIQGNTGLYSRWKWKFLGKEFKKNTQKG